MIRHNKQQAELKAQQTGYREFLNFLVKRVELA
jgi:hypothetical protein